MGIVIFHLNAVMDGMNNQDAYVFAQTYSLKQGLKRYKEEGRKAVNKEVGQLHNRKVFIPIHLHEMTTLERKRAMESLIFLTEKRNKTIKARTYANGSTP